MTSVFQERLQTAFQSCDKDSSLHKLRARCWDRFLELGSPVREREVYRYIKLSKLYAQEFEKAASVSLDPSLAASRLLSVQEGALIVCVNGCFAPELSDLSALPRHTIVLPMEKAIQTYSAFLNNHLTRSLKGETDPFAALNGALQHKGLFIYLPPNTVIEQPVEILNLIDLPGIAGFVTPKIHVYVGKQSQIQLTVRDEWVRGETFFLNQCLDMTLEEGAVADVNHTNLGFPRSAWAFTAFRAVMKRDGRLRSTAVTTGAGTVRNDYRIELTGENAEASLNGLWTLGGTHEAHTNVLIEHQAPYCRSMQLFKGLLNDASTSSFEGKILVRQAAQKTDAFQLNNNLLLSDKATANSKPNLEIFADDVKASHGATVGQLDADQLFYLRTRGYDTRQAHQILSRAYCAEVLNLIQHRSLLDKIHSELGLD